MSQNDPEDLLTLIYQNCIHPSDFYNERRRVAAASDLIDKLKRCKYQCGFRIWEQLTV